MRLPFEGPHFYIEKVRRNKSAHKGNKTPKKINKHPLKGNKTL